MGEQLETIRIYVYVHVNVYVCACVSCKVFEVVTQ